MRLRFPRSTISTGALVLVLVLSSCQGSTESRQRNLGVENFSNPLIINTFTTTKKASEAYVAVDKSENIYSVNDKSSYVTRIDAEGLVNPKWADVGSTNSSGIEVDASGNLYVLISDLNLVRKFDSSGIFLKDFLVGKTPSSITIDIDGNVFVSNIGDNSISKILSDGELVVNWYRGTDVVSTISNPPSSIDVDTSGNVYSIICGQNAINQINPSGNLMQIYKVLNPTDITITPNNVLYVVNKTNIITEIKPILNTITKINAGNQFNITNIESNENGNVYINNILNNTKINYIYEVINKTVANPILIDNKMIYASNIICSNFNGKIYTVNNLIDNSINITNNYIYNISEIIPGIDMSSSSSFSSSLPEVTSSSSSPLLDVPVESSSSSSSSIPAVAPSSSSLPNVPVVSSSSSLSTMPDAAPSSSSPSSLPVMSSATVADPAKTSTSLENVDTVAPARSMPEVVIAPEVIATAVASSGEKAEGIVVSPMTTEVVCGSDCVEAFLKTTGVIDGEVSVAIGDAAPVALPMDNQLKLNVGSKDVVMKFTVTSPEGKETVVNVPVTHSSSVPEPVDEPTDSNTSLYLIIAGALVLLGLAGYLVRRKTT